MDSRVGSLIALLLDQTAALRERDDAAMDLGEFDDDRVLAALVITACDSSEDEILLASCGESIGLILKRTCKAMPCNVSALQPSARREFEAAIEVWS